MSSVLSATRKFARMGISAPAQEFKKVVNASATHLDQALLSADGWNAYNTYKESAYLQVLNETLTLQEKVNFLLLEFPAFITAHPRRPTSNSIGAVALYLERLRPFHAKLHKKSYYNKTKACKTQAKDMAMSEIINDINASKDAEGSVDDKFVMQAHRKLKSAFADIEAMEVDDEEENEDN